VITRAQQQGFTAWKWFIRNLWECGTFSKFSLASS